MFFKWFREIKEEQVRLERGIKILLFNILTQIKEIKALNELNGMRVERSAKKG